MTWQDTPYTLPLLVAAAASAVLVFLLSWRSRHVASVRTGMLLALACVVWMLASALELASVELEAKTCWWHLEYVGICTIPPAWLVYTLQYTAREDRVTCRNVALFAIVPAVTFLLVLTNESHGLILNDIRLDTSGSFTVTQSTRGLGLWVFIVYAYATLAAGLFFLIKALLRSGRLYRWQATALVVVALVSWLVNALADIRGFGPLTQLDLTPLALGVTIPVMAWSLDRLRRRDLVPVARDAVLEALADAVVVLDARDRIVDLNPAARRLLGAPKIEILGQPVEKVWSGWAAGVAHGAGNEMVVAAGEEKRTLDVCVSPVVDWRGNVVSRAVVLRDVTDLKRQTAELSALLQKQILLRQVGAAITSALDPEIVLSRIAEQIAQAADVTSAYICRYNPETRESTVLAEYIGPEACAPEQVSDLGMVYVEVDREFIELMRLGQHDMEHVDDPDLHEQDRRHMEMYGARSVLYIPLQIQDRLIGFAELWESRRRREFSPSEIALCRDIARQAAIALENARVYALAQEEIAERRRTEAKLEAALRDKEVLLKEIHHRVKNNLQVVSSLLNLQSELVRDSQTLEMIAESRDRIRVMALVHEQLYQAPDLARVNLVAYVETLANQLFRSLQKHPATIRLHVDVQDAMLGITAAVPCGLLINELLSNALKHAFPAGQSGNVYLGLGEGGGQFTLVVGDDGIGFPAGVDFRNTESLGLQLVTILVEQLGGAIDLECGTIATLEGGGSTVFRISFQET